MTDTRQDPETVLAGFEPPGPPEGLRDRALRRAGDALDRPPAQDRWARIYANRPLRAAWAAAVLVLVVANILLPTASRRPRKDWFIERAAGRVSELREVVAVPRLREAYVSVDGFADRRPVVFGPSLPESRRKEKTS
jgi:hypothetical protein